MNKTISMLKMNNLNVKVKIGVSDEERLVDKEISIYVAFHFATLPKSCIDDNIENTICYYTVSKAIENYCKNKEFKLIEYLGYEIHQLLKEIYGMDQIIEIRIIKKNPLGNNILENAEFMYIE